VCYCHRTSSQTWANAASACVAWGGQLAALSTKAETDFVNARLTSYGAKDVFIGGTDAAVDGVWKWVNGESWSYTNWLPGEPSTAALDDCVALRAGGAFGWDATNCNGKEHYLCER
jgi:hypothetical protein